MKYQHDIDVRQVGIELYVTLQGPFDYSRAGELLGLMNAHYDDPIETIILDLQRVDTLDSTWIWEIETLRFRARRASIGLTMRVPQASRVTGILRQAGFGALFLGGKTHGVQETPSPTGVGGMRPLLP